MKNLIELSLDNPKIILSEDKKIVELTAEQKQAIVDFWNSYDNGAPSIKDICIHIFGEEYDTRSGPITAIRKFLATREIKQNKTVQSHSHEQPKPEIILDEDQKEYIRIHLKNGEKPIEIIRDLFENPKLHPLSTEYKVVNAYIETLDKKEYSILTEKLGNYRPPKSLESAAVRVNRSAGVENSIGLDIIKVSEKPWEKNSKLESNLYALMEMMHSPRFIMLCNRYTEEEERSLFENTLVSYIWEKPDLLPEEIDLYINAATEIVNDLRLDKEIVYYLELLQATAEDNDGKKISLSIGDHLNNLRSQKNDAQDKVQKIIKMLQGERSKRVENKIKENDSIIGLIDFWKQKQNRDKMIELAQKQSHLVEEEIKRLEDIDQLKALVAGLTPNQAIRG